MVVKEISDLLGKPDEDGDTGFYLGGVDNEEILYKNGKPTGFTICEPMTGRTGNRWIYNSFNQRVGILAGPKFNEIFDSDCNRTGFYLDKELYLARGHSLAEKIKYKKILDERKP